MSEIIAHQDLPDAGEVTHQIIDRHLPDAREKALLIKLRGAPESVSGARDDPEAALANLLAALEDLGLINDNTSAS